MVISSGAPNLSYQSLEVRYKLLADMWYYPLGDDSQTNHLIGDFIKIDRIRGEEFVPGLAPYSYALCGVVSGTRGRWIPAVTPNGRCVSCLAIIRKGTVNRWGGIPCIEDHHKDTRRGAINALFLACRVRNMGTHRTPESFAKNVVPVHKHPEAKFPGVVWYLMGKNYFLGHSLEAGPFHGVWLPKETETIVRRPISVIG